MKYLFRTFTKGLFCHKSQKGGTMLFLSFIQKVECFSSQRLPYKNVHWETVRISAEYIIEIYKYTANETKRRK